MELTDITTEKVKYNSLPDPKVAPYGVSAMEWLKLQPWTEPMKNKFVYAQSSSGVINYNSEVYEKTFVESGFDRVK